MVNITDAETLKKLNSSPWPNLRFVEPGSCPRCSGAAVVWQEDELPQRIIKSRSWLSESDATEIRKAYMEKKEHPFAWIATRIRYGISASPLKAGIPRSDVGKDRIMVIGTIKGGVDAKDSDSSDAAGSSDNPS